MKQAVIDIGSNSMRLTLYEVEGGAFRTLFREKIMAGLAGYVEQDRLSGAGIARACGALGEFRQTLESLGITRTAVFATASLRNIRNTAEAVAALQQAAGTFVEVISGQEEATLGYMGAMQELHWTSGALADIGGASTEVAIFSHGKLETAVSYPIGALALYRKCVKHILPGKASLAKLRSTIQRQLDPAGFPAPQEALAFVGGTARAVLHIGRRLCNLPPECSALTADQLEQVCRLLCRCDRTATDWILKLEPDRIHTMVPGVLILQSLVERFDARRIVVSRYGVREGYLCRHLL